jgi:hypothetical protein
VKGGRVVQALAVYRGFAGVSGWLAPSQLARAFALETSDGSALAYAARLAAVRELTLGVGPLISDGQARRTWLRLALLCDLADTLAAATGARGRFTRRRGGARRSGDDHLWTADARRAAIGLAVVAARTTRVQFFPLKQPTAANSIVVTADDRSGYAAGCRCRTEQ